MSLVRARYPVGSHLVEPSVTRYRPSFVWQQSAARERVDIVDASGQIAAILSCEWVGATMTGETDRRDV